MRIVSFDFGLWPSSRFPSEVAPRLIVTKWMTARILYALREPVEAPFRKLVVEPILDTFLPARRIFRGGAVYGVELPRPIDSFDGEPERIRLESAGCIQEAFEFLWSEGLLRDAPLREVARSLSVGPPETRGELPKLRKQDKRAGLSVEVWETISDQEARAEIVVRDSGGGGQHRVVARRTKPCYPEDLVPSGCKAKLAGDTYEIASKNGAFLLRLNLRTGTVEGPLTAPDFDAFEHS